MLREQLDSPDLSDQARESINARLIELVELDASKDTEDKEHRRDLHLNSNKAFLMGVAVVVTAGVAVVNPDAAKALFRTAVKNGPQAAKALT